MNHPLLPRSLFASSILLGLIAAAPVGARAEPAPIVPRETIVLFNGKDLAPFYTWLQESGHEDPLHVFTVEPDVDGAPAIHISGDGFGGLVTRQTYAHYKLVAEFRWGTKTWRRRIGKARDSGILLYCQGEDGNSQKDFLGPWPRSIEFQIIEGGTGDLLTVGGYERGSTAQILPHLRATVVPAQPPSEFGWNPSGIPTEKFPTGRIDWLRRDPDWKDVAGFHGRADAEKPSGQWNRIEGICDGGHLTYFVNGEKVNEATGCTFQSGRLLVQSEGAEIYFHRIELQPLSQ